MTVWVTTKAMPAGISLWGAQVGEDGADQARESTVQERFYL